MNTPTLDMHLAHPLDIARRRRAGERDVIVNEFLAGLQTGGVIGMVQRCGGDVVGLAWHDDPLAASLEQIEGLHSEIEQSGGRLRLVLDPGDWPEAEDGAIGVVLHLEGLAPVGQSLDVLDALYRLGVRTAQLTWNGRNAIASGVGMSDGDLGLTGFGRECVRRMNELGIVIDLAHLAPEGAAQVISISEAPVVNTHSNARALCDHPRNITDDQMRDIVSTGGIVGAVGYGEFIDPTEQTLDRLVDHIDHMVSVVGHENVGVGSDFTDYADDLVSSATKDAGIYAGYGFPDDFYTVSQFPDLWEALRGRGYSEEQVDGIARGNFRRVFASIRETRTVG
jgi:membrane dipeptidase